MAANGLPAVLGIAAALLGHPRLGACAFAGALAALGADTIATEIGTRYGGVPRHVVTLRPLDPGESGGVTWAGLGASVLGALLAPAAFLLSGGLDLPEPSGGFVLVMLTLAGFNAGVLDSVLGATLQRKGTCTVCGRTVESRTHCDAPVPTQGTRFAFLDNDAVNLANGVAGAVLGAWLPTLFLP